MSLDHQVTPMLRTLRQSGVLQTLDVRNEQAVEQQPSHVEFLGSLLQDEVERRAQNTLRLRLRRASFDSSKTLGGFDFRFNPQINKAAVFDHLPVHREKGTHPDLRSVWRRQESLGPGTGPRSMDQRPIQGLGSLSTAVDAVTPSPLRSPVHGIGDLRA